MRKQRILGLLFVFFSLIAYVAYSPDSAGDPPEASSLSPSDPGGAVPPPHGQTGSLQKKLERSASSSASVTALGRDRDIVSLQREVELKMVQAREQGLSEEVKELQSGLRRSEGDRSQSSEKIHSSLQNKKPTDTSLNSTPMSYPRYDQQGRVLVKILYEPGPDREEVIHQVLDEQMGTIYAQLPEEGILEAYVDPGRLDNWAIQPWVRRIVPVAPVRTRQGSVTTEADQVLGVANLREKFQIAGRGIRVGVISSGVDHIEDSQAKGDLPSDIVVVANGGWGQPDDEGTAMLEIIHDLAPEAKLYFHDGGSETRFIQAIRSFKEAKCDIIVDDLGYPGEPFFEDGLVATEAQKAVDSGTVFVSAAGNDAEKHVEIPWSAQHIDPEDNNINELLFRIPALVFPSDEEMMVFEIGPYHAITAILQWTERFGASSHDYDLFIYKSSDYEAFLSDVLVYLDWLIDGKGQLESQGYWVDSKGRRHFTAPLLPQLNVVTSGEEPQTGTGDPIETVEVRNLSSKWESYILTIEGVKNPDESDSLEMLFWDYGQTGALGIPGKEGTAKGSIYGHPAVPGCFAVGAIHVRDPELDTIQSYSSQGPSYVPFSEIVQRNKPDFVSVDGISVTGVGGFSTPFYGTSAAAPHVAGLIALFKEADPSLTPDRIRQILGRTALDLGDPGQDNVYGYGSIDLEEALSTLDSDTLTVDSTEPLVDLKFRSDQRINLKCMAAAGQKNWVFVQAPDLYPGLIFARPSDSLAGQQGRYLVLFQQGDNLPAEANSLYYSEAFPIDKIDFGINDFRGLGKIIIATHKGSVSTSLELIQEITLTPY